LATPPDTEFDRGDEAGVVELTERAGCRVF